jgi:hypothetical protein
LDIKETIIDEIWAKQFGKDMSEEWMKKLPQKNLNWIPTGRGSRVAQAV